MTRELLNDSLECHSFSEKKKEFFLDQSKKSLQVALASIRSFSGKYDKIKNRTSDG